MAHVIWIMIRPGTASPWVLTILIGFLWRAHLVGREPAALGPSRGSSVQELLGACMKFLVAVPGASGLPEAGGGLAPLLAAVDMHRVLGLFLDCCSRYSK